MNQDVSKALHYHKLIFQLTSIINSKRLDTTIWSDKYNLGSECPTLITKAEIRKRARIMRKRLKQKLIRIENKYTPKFKQQMKKVALEEVSRRF